MLNFEIGPLAEAQKKTARGRSRVILEYVDLIMRLGPGQAGRLVPDAGETTQAIKRRLGTAAQLAGIDLTMKKVDDIVYFWIENRRRGRPTKVTLDD